MLVFCKNKALLKKRCPKNTIEALIKIDPKKLLKSKKQHRNGDDRSMLMDMPIIKSSDKNFYS
jgi:hypothetical protein